MTTNWHIEFAKAVANDVSETGYTVVLRGNDGSVTIGRTYGDRAVAFGQATRLQDDSGPAVFVATKRAGKVTVYTGPRARLVCIDA